MLFTKPFSLLFARQSTTYQDSQTLEAFCSWCWYWIYNQIGNWLLSRSRISSESFNERQQSQKVFEDFCSIFIWKLPNWPLFFSVPFSCNWGERSKAETFWKKKAVKQNSVESLKKTETKLCHWVIKNKKTMSLPGISAINNFAL